MKSILIFFLTTFLALSCNKIFDSSNPELYRLRPSPSQPSFDDPPSEDPDSVFSIEAWGRESTDDGQEAGGYVNTYFNYIELRVDLGRWGGAYRFPNVRIPQGAEVVSAFVEIQNYVSLYKWANIEISCENVDSARGILGGGGTYDLSARWDDKIYSSVFWRDSINSIPGERDSTPDLKALVQEIVERPGWKPGNAIIFLFKCLSLGGDQSNLELYTWDLGDHSCGGVLYVRYRIRNTEDAELLKTLKEDKR